MNRTKRTQLAIVALAAMVLAAGRIAADQANCEVISSGGMVGNTPGSVMIVGQTAIGFATNGDTAMFAGHVYCLTQGPQVACLLGDVDNNGLIDGRDIDEYLMVYIDGIGTPQQICAANIEVEQFVALLLAQ
ncbi:MAG: hypothetical protein H6819_00800 [Phycisphaerales bacterium]|nr:hypothetical protein [Phycisphaerales bacterium]MCB9857254.1 hypothetical protein [Phycisphaerales bacterium]MCB9863032.1 hypothetical protein [Phycisphaerales bacterium]